MNTNFHTESRMRENCTYGSMRGWAYPTRGVPLYSTPSESADHWQVLFENLGFAVILVLILVAKHRLTEWKKMRLA